MNKHRRKALPPLNKGGGRGFKTRGLVALCFLFSVLLAPAGASPLAVQRYFQDLDSLQADFEQTVFDDKANIVQTSSGQMSMKKPGRFRWDYRQPFQQVIVADGERIWLYDSELEQVSVRKLDQALSATPLALLSGAAPIENAFVIKQLPPEGNIKWYQLDPKQEQSEFKRLRVAFLDEVLYMIELEDVFNRRTRLQFRNPRRNVPIDPTLLRFKPPPGVDVVGDAP